MYTKGKTIHFNEPYFMFYLIACCPLHNMCALRRCYFSLAWIYTALEIRGNLKEEPVFLYHPLTTSSLKSLCSTITADFKDYPGVTGVWMLDLRLIFSAGGGLAARCCYITQMTPEIKAEADRLSLGEQSPLRLPKIYTSCLIHILHLYKTPGGISTHRQL